jgi:hypothetical protein
MSLQSKARGTRSGSVTDVFLIETGHLERVLVSSADHAYAGDLRDWFCYTKPIGGDLTIIARPRNKAYPGFCVHTAGSDSDAGEREVRHSSQKNKPSAQVCRSE